mgnify:CR=1 FL=1|jgi:hypothetical protein
MHRAEIRVRHLNNSVWVLLAGIAIIAGLGFAWIQGDQGGPKLDAADTIAITKASFLFQFARSNDWPEETKEGNFKIGIHGNRVLFNFLVEKYSNQSIGSQMLEVVWYEEAEMSEYTHILYSESEGEDLDRLIKSTGNQPVMVVTSVNGELKMPKGSVMNFVIQSSKIRYELDMDNAILRGLVVGNRILSWAVTR